MIRFLLKDGERRPDPEPVQTDDRKAALVGLSLWIIAFVVAMVMGPALPFDFGLVFWTCIAGIVIGLIGLAYTHHQHTR